MADRFLHWQLFGLVISSLYGGLAVAALAGRIASHYINMPLWQLLSLYAYALIQVLFDVNRTDMGLGPLQLSVTWKSPYCLCRN